MLTRRIGKLEVSLLGLGGNNFGRPRQRGGPIVGPADGDLEMTTEVVQAALEVGINFIDTAEEYALGESEEFIGRALGARRDEVVIATKFNSGLSPTPGQGAGRQRIIRSAEDSLRRLDTDRIDLYQIHRPDPTTPIEETLAALDRLVADGKVLEIGCCNFSGQQVEEATAAASAHGLRPFATDQIGYSLLSSRGGEEIIPSLVAQGMGLIPYWPLGGGILTGKYRRGEAPAPDSRLAARPEEERNHLLRQSTFDRVERLETFATRHGRSLLEVALLWLARQEIVASVIVGATSSAQVRQNAGAIERPLSTEEWDELEEIRTGRRPGAQQ